MRVITWIKSTEHLRRFALKLRLIIDIRLSSYDFRDLIGHAKIKIRKAVARDFRIALYESTNERDIARISQRARACMERSRPSPWRSWTIVGALRQTGTKMAAVAEERTSRSLGDCVMAARAGVSRGPTRWTSYEARTPLTSPSAQSPLFLLSSPYTAGPLFFLFTLFLSRTRLYPRYHGDDECQPR